MTTTPGINTNGVLLDSDALIAHLEIDDASHSLAVKIFNFLATNNVPLFISSTVVAEVVTTFQRRFSNKKSRINIFKQSLSESVTIIPVDKEILRGAYEYFVSSLSKHNTVFDAINIAVMKKYDFDAIFSFDSWYRKHGIKLAEDLV